jgi:dihydroorotate dehydrogenase electron transfer subunit
VNSTVARVTEATALGADLVLLRLEAPEIARLARPGQFAMVRCGDGLDPFLPRPMWIALRGEGAAAPLALLVRAAGRGSGWLASRREGDGVACLGPLGQPLVLLAETRNLLLIAEGVQVAGLLLLVEAAIAHGVAVTLLQVAANGELVVPPSLLPAEVEAVMIDAAERPPDTAALAGYLRWADQIVAATGEPLQRTVAAWLRTSQSRTPARGLPGVALPCGTGICGDCAIETRRRGTRLICRDGPAFELRELY